MTAVSGDLVLARDGRVLAARGWFGSLAEAAAAMRGPVRGFAPAMGEAVRAARLTAWREALAKV